MSYVNLEKRDGICTIIMNRPQNFNALDFELGDQLVSALEQCFDDDIRVVILTARGKVFSSGGDLKAAQKYVEKDPSYFYANLTKRLNRIITDIRLLPKPVIASVNGSVGGAGISLVLACDLRIASEEAKFRQSYTSIGLCPDGLWTILAPIVLGWGKANEMAYIDNPIDSSEALRLGLVNKVVPAAQLQEATWKWADQLAKGPTFAFAQVKDLLNQALLNYMGTLLEKERQSIIRCAKTEDYKEGLRAFFEKRPANFTGR